MLKNLMMGAAVAALSVTAMAGAANALVIDSFTDAPQVISINGPAPPVTTVTLLDNDSSNGGASPPGPGPFGSIAGGYRDVSTTLLTSPDENFATSGVVTIGLGVFSHSQDSLVQSFSSLKWDGLTGTGMDIDLTDGGSSDKFHLVLLEADNSVEWKLSVTETVAAGGTTSFITFFNPIDVVLGDPAAHLYRDFSLFSPLIDFSHIASIEFTANNNQLFSFDTTLALVETVGVPEPASLTLLGAGIMGLGYFGRRRRA